MNILEKISQCILDMNEDDIEGLIGEAINTHGINIKDVYLNGINKGMVEAINYYEQKKYDIPEIIVCADTLKKGLKKLNEYGKLNSKSKGKILLSVVDGDTHEIGKNIVKIMLEAAGYEVIDLGVNNSCEKIIKASSENNVDVIGLGSMMTTTRGEMKKVIDARNSTGMKKPYIIVGGGSVTKAYSDEIGADGYGINAPEEIKIIEALLKEEK